MKSWKLAAISLALAALSTTGFAKTIKISTTVPETSNWMVAANTFKKVVEAKTDHKVEIYPNGVLVSGNDRVELEMAQAGAVDIILKDHLAVATESGVPGYRDAVDVSKRRSGDEGHGWPDW